jgi:hypothetical protein
MILLTVAGNLLTAPLWSQTPVITSFTAAPAVTNPGVVTGLFWSVANAGTVTIDQGIGAVT